MELICLLLVLYLYVVIFRIILGMVVEFMRIGWGHPVRRIADVLGYAVDPLLRPIRNVISPMRMGGLALDLSPIVLLVGISVVRAIIC